MPFDDEDPSVIGKTVLIGVTYFDATGQETGRSQWWGRILAFNMNQGLRVDLRCAGKAHAFPPFAEALRPAKAGTYKLRSTGEVVADPDFLYTIANHKPAR